MSCQIRILARMRKQRTCGVHRPQGNREDYLAHLPAQSSRDYKFGLS
jgi:hypothetical protein